MAKPKFVLTSDLVKVEPEPVFVQTATPSLEREIAPANTDSFPLHPPLTPHEKNEGEGVHSEDKKGFPQDNFATTQGQPFYEAHPKISSGEAYPSPPKHTPVSNSSDIFRPTPADASFEAPSKTSPVTLRESSLFLRMRESNQPSVVRDQFNLKIDRDLKRDFRLWCLLREISMTEALEDAIRFYMEKIDRMER